MKLSYITKFSGIVVLITLIALFAHSSFVFGQGVPDPVAPSPTELPSPSEVPSPTLPNTQPTLPEPQLSLDAAQQATQIQLEAAQQQIQQTAQTAQEQIQTTAQNAQAQIDDAVQEMEQRSSLGWLGLLGLFGLFGLAGRKRKGDRVVHTQPLDTDIPSSPRL